MRLDGRWAPTVDVIADATDALEDAYRGVRVPAGKGPDHGREVAAVLRSAGCPEAVQVAGLLHDVVEDTPSTIDEIAARFGPYVAALVGAVTEDADIGNYGRRKRVLRDQIAAAGSPATDIALADKVATLRFLRLSGRPLAKRKRAHYEATLAGASRTARPRLVREVAELLEALAERDAAASGPQR
jgi:(p)ppGpp synthase/HD superfamily hydrolase